ncbi:LLM class flavin-dependent oxidoreductase [Actinoplanes friuliensis]|uniref:FAD linked oxidase domain-containing protein n=1 Tax=Actinoplanes friuliensis DSM 7358 TaxID=1246995 RepID=U5VTC6_9ACTN|nr:LLM class flavin-dependent oxidoreductase [Actinoplanes friuliensis]AGZ38990.1 FAD linked oxidase domain-containing protein [Actinoplanes friuliensis DSM 7358]
MNYGHPLKFGVFITPGSTAPGEPVALAQRAEAFGYDLVTFQDHPYQPRFLDTWTLLSWVAGRTERIHLAANVLNVPLRDPAVLARSAASLDLLSGGRLDLALGAGAFWDAIEAMGGRKLSPGQAVEALEEAIDVVRGVLDAGEPGPLRHLGEHYRIPAAQRGPLPAHRIPLWLGGYKPRMLRLTGRKADGWLPTLSAFKPGEFAAANKIIDEAALAAGREPAEIRRLVNITPDRTVDELLPLVLEDGVGTFIVMTDDAATLERFAAEIAPALREAVARELPEAPTAVFRTTAVRAKRRTGISYDTVPASLAEAAVEPGDLDYARVRSTYMRGGAPGLVLRASSTAEVVDALAFVREHPGVPFAVRSGGHGISGRSTNDGGLVLSLAALNTIEVLDTERRLIRVGAGARWTDVADALLPYGWALSSGDYGGVGVGGLATAAGVGWLARKHGLTIDHLRAVEVVLADGSVVRASEEENPDLFWAVRGAGANFGVVTSFDFEVDEVGDVGWGQFVVGADDPADLLVRWGAAVEAAPRDLTANLIMGRPRPGQPGYAQIMAMVDSSDPQTIIDQLTPVASVGPLYQQNVVLTPYAGVMANVAEGYHQGQGEPVARSGLIEHLTPEFAAAAAELIASGAIHWFQIRAVGGAVADVPEDATAYAHRSANFSIVVMGSSRRRVDPLWDALAAHFDGLYLSFETDLRPERVADAFPPRTLERLRELKHRYDPQNLFRDNFNIEVGTR